jgi:hypothetical protein
MSLPDIRNMQRPAVLDLYCCGGGAGEGLRQAGFKTVIGIDRDDHKASYEHNGKIFVQFDVLKLPVSFVRQFDLVWASPPCQVHCTLIPKAQREKFQAKWEAEGRHLDLIPGTRALLQKARRPYIIENVCGARAQLRNPIMLCGMQFDLNVFRHRLFECEGFTATPPPKCSHANAGIGALSGGIKPVRTEMYENDAAAALRAGEAPQGFSAKEVRFASHGDRVDHVYVAVTEEMKKLCRQTYKRTYCRSIKEALRLTKELRELTPTEKAKDKERYDTQLKERLPEGAKQCFPIYGLTSQRGSTEEWCNALGAGQWMTRGELRESVPPAYSAYLARQFLTQMKA